jgi:hypothetical protein
MDAREVTKDLEISSVAKEYRLCFGLVSGHDF